MRKLLAVGVIVLFIGVAFAPSINANVSKASIDNELVEITTEVCGIHGDIQSLKKAIVFGFFPQISSDNITYFGIPQFQWMIIPKDKFEGYIGVFFIFGFYNSSPIM